MKGSALEGECSLGSTLARLQRDVDVLHSTSTAKAKNLEQQDRNGPVAWPTLSISACLLVGAGVDSIHAKEIPFAKKAGKRGKTGENRGKQVKTGGKWGEWGKWGGGLGNRGWEMGGGGAGDTNELPRLSALGSLPLRPCPCPFLLHRARH